jgi:hypothetical protein
MCNRIDERRRHEMAAQDTALHKIQNTTSKNEHFTEYLFVLLQI